MTVQMLLRYFIFLLFWLVHLLHIVHNHERIVVVVVQSRRKEQREREMMVRLLWERGMKTMSRKTKRFAPAAASSWTIWWIFFLQSICNVKRSEQVNKSKLKRWPEVVRDKSFIAKESASSLPGNAPEHGQEQQQFCKPEIVTLSQSGWTFCQTYRTFSQTYRTFCQRECKFMSDWMFCEWCFFFILPVWTWWFTWCTPQGLQIGQISPEKFTIMSSPVWVHLFEGWALGIFF